MEDLMEQGTVNRIGKKHRPSTGGSFVHDKSSISNQQEKRWIFQ